MGPAARRRPGDHRVRADVGAARAAVALPGDAARLPAHLWPPAGRGDLADLQRAYARSRAEPPRSPCAGSVARLSRYARPPGGVLTWIDHSWNKALQSTA